MSMEREGGGGGGGGESRGVPVPGRTSPALPGEVYYLRALDYLSSSADSAHGEGSRFPHHHHIHHLHDDEDDDDDNDDCIKYDFNPAVGLRRFPLRRDSIQSIDEGIASDFSCSPDLAAGYLAAGGRFRSGSDVNPASRVHHTSYNLSDSSSSSKSHASSSSSTLHRERKLSIGSKGYTRKTSGCSSSGSGSATRKLSDGHVHWADEFHKDLERSRPRKTYSRHPSHLNGAVKPILKAGHSFDSNGQCEYPDFGVPVNDDEDQ